MMNINIESLVVNVGDDGRVELSACSDAEFESRFAFAALSAEDALYLAGVLVRASEMADGITSMRRRRAGPLFNRREPGQEFKTEGTA